MAGDTDSTAQIAALERRFDRYVGSDNDNRSDPTEELTDGGSFLNSTLTDAILTDPALSNANFSGVTSFSGSVGIGTSSPAELLSVAGPIYLDDVSPANTASRLYNSGGLLYFDGAPVASGGGGSGTVLPSATAGLLAYYPSATSTVDDATGLYWNNASTRLGIGTSSPYATLSVVGKTVADSFVATLGTATSTLAGDFNVGSDVFAVLTDENYVQVGNTTTGARMTLISTDTGNNSYGNNMFRLYNPNSDVEMGFSILNGMTGSREWVIGNNQSSNLVIGSYTIGGIADSESHFVLQGGGTDKIGVFNSGNQGNTTFEITNQTSGSSATFDPFAVSSAPAQEGDYFIVKNGGKVGIGTTSPYAKLSVVGNIVSTATTTANRVVTSDNTAYWLGNTPVLSGVTARNSFFFAGARASSSFGTADYNYAIGSNALGNLTTGDFNVAMGSGALKGGGGGLSGSYNIALGSSSLFNNTSGTYNTAFGSGALGSNSSGSYNNAFGPSTLVFNSSGSYNNAIGSSAGFWNTTGSYNNAIGSSAGFNTTVGSYNNTLGYYALNLNTTGSYNNAIGYRALWSNNGTGTIAIGYQVADNAASVDRSIFIGYDIDAFSTTQDDVLNIGNLIFGTGVDGTGTTYSTGNIGIGTSTPGAKLQVKGSAILGVAGVAVGSSTLTLRGDSATANAEIFAINAQRSNYDPTGTAASIVFARATGGKDGKILFKTHNGTSLQERLTIASTGYVGIGTTSPYAKLSVAGDIVSTGTITAPELTVTSTSTAPRFVATDDRGYWLNSVDVLSGSTTLDTYFFGGATASSSVGNAIYNYAIGSNALA
ncbi:MAG: hypothetical protein KC877_01485, partial [Candidatus Kaiserbacteria bacterium]|nr:hypothetical protein [Candidatus Kaiserbacteria bacterium]